MKRICVYIESNEMFYFFNRFKDAANKNDCDLLFTTVKLSIFLLSKFNGIKCILIKSSSINHINDSKIYSSKEVLLKKISKLQAEQLYNSVFESLRKIHCEFPIDYFLFFNGTSIPAIAYKSFADENNIKTVYIELANIPGKMFCDSQGVNAEASIYNKIDILKNFPVLEYDYKNWLNEYINQRENQRDIPQVQQVNKYINYLFLLDIVAFRIFNIPKNSSYKFIDKIKNKYLIKFPTIKYDDLDVLKEDYIFLGLQLSDDSQLILNSEIDNIKAIEIAMSYSSRLKTNLVVKIHPVERNINLIFEILTLRKKYGFKLVNGNAFKLIQYSKFVIVNNSSIALEAKIIDKKVIFLGRSFYKYLNKYNLPNYIISYLINLDYFSNNSLNIEILKLILKRAEYKS